MGLCTPYSMNRLLTAYSMNSLFTYPTRTTRTTSRTNRTTSRTTRTTPRTTSTTRRVVLVILFVVVVVLEVVLVILEVVLVVLELVPSSEIFGVNWNEIFGVRSPLNQEGARLLRRRYGSLEPRGLLRSSSPFLEALPLPPRHKKTSSVGSL